MAGWKSPHLLLALVTILFQTSSAIPVNATYACEICTCWARATCDEDKDNPFYSADNLKCKTGIIDCGGLGLTEAPPIRLGNVTVSELDQIYGTTSMATYPISKVWLSGNSFSTIPADYFDEVASTVEEIRMNNIPTLTTLESGTFANKPLLRAVLLHYGGLTTLPANLFTNTPNLYRIWMNDNYISTVHADAFKGVTAMLHELYLYNNFITSLDVTTFSDMTGLTQLWMMNNKDESRGSVEKLTDLGCSHLCAVPTDCDIKASNFTLLCGSGCAASSLGIDHPIRSEDTANVCGYSNCVSWDLSAAGSLGGWWVTAFGAVMASAAMLAMDIV
mmetsp:Transcript_23776/g.47312  ORF Transcript_23776/g.47312 Transcript_23776/m.47312 type:complete len:333 (+) Transcript_23776:115-1113(+)